MKFAIYDTETTGLPSHQKAFIGQQPRIIELGGIITDGEKVLDQIEFICNPGIAIEEIITKITGLTNDDLRDKSPFSDYVPQMQAFFSQADASVAHNASFDKNLLVFDLRRIKLGLGSIAFPQLNICTVEETYHLYGRRMKLIELYTSFCGEYVQKHRALDDVMCLFEIAKRIGLFEAFMEVDQ